MAQAMQAPVQGMGASTAKMATTSQAQGSILTVVSPKGGVGRTVVAANLAVALRLSTQKKVALVEARSTSATWASC